jgi:hypothetical protein
MLDGAVALTMDMSKSNLFPKEMAGNIKGEGTGAGTVECSIDEATGWLTHRLENSQTTCKISIKMPEELKGMAQGAPASMEMTEEITLKVEVTNSAA